MLNSLKRPGFGRFHFLYWEVDCRKILIIKVGRRLLLGKRTVIEYLEERYGNWS